MYRNHCNTLPNTHYTGGRNNFIADLIRAKTHRLETWGNAREGFAVYLTAAPDYSSGVQISSGSYSRRCDAVDACQRIYGDAGYVVKVSKGRNWL